MVKNDKIIYIIKCQKSEKMPKITEILTKKMSKNLCKMSEYKNYRKLQNFSHIKINFQHFKRCREERCKFQRQKQHPRSSNHASLVQAGKEKRDDRGDAQILHFVPKCRADSRKVLELQKSGCQARSPNFKNRRRLHARLQTLQRMRHSF